jgi:hypothetical protein
MDTGDDDPSTQVLVWDCSDCKRLKMPIRELYNKVGKTALLSPNFEALSENFSGSENIKQEHIPKKGRVSIQGASFDLSILLRIQRIFGRYQTLYIVGAS